MTRTMFMKRVLPVLAIVVASAFNACTTDDGPDIRYKEPGSLVQKSGEKSFTFGASSAATQIEDQNPNTDWYKWTQPKADGGMGQGEEFVGEAVGSWSDPERDLALIQELGLDSYRFSIEWARVEPERGVYDEAAIQKYSDFIDRLIEMGVQPNVTLYHFSNPQWVFGEQNMNCDEENGITPTHLCGWDDPDSVEILVEDIARYAGHMAKTFGDRVDVWATFNEPVNYIVAAYGIGYFPPGRSYIVDSIGKDASAPSFQKLVSVYRNYLTAHVAMYNAIKESDTTDADGDGNAADVGLTLNTVAWKPAYRDRLSDDEVDVAAAQRMLYFYHFLMIDSLTQGTFDPELSGEGTEAHPDWKGTIDWLGIQYYFHSGVTGHAKIIPGLNLMICQDDLDLFGACFAPDETMNKWIPSMRYEYDEVGLYDILMSYAERYPTLPMAVTEAGIATNNSRRRSENIVRTLEQMERARKDGADIRGYFHWSLTDNFEWHEGYGPRFGLYSVDRESPDFTRTATQGAVLYKEIIEQRKVTEAMLQEYGGVGPLSPETDELE